MEPRQSGPQWNPFGPRAGGMVNEGVIIGGDNHGAVANGPHASAHMSAPAGDPAGPQALRAAAEALRAALHEVRTQQPDAVPEEDAQDAEQALREILDESAREEPSGSRLRRRVRSVADALGDVTLLATAVAALEHAFAGLTW